MKKVIGANAWSYILWYDALKKDVLSKWQLLLKMIIFYYETK